MNAGSVAEVMFRDPHRKEAVHGDHGVKGKDGSDHRFPSVIYEIIVLID
jgi:hypothetical protein